jgi:hypothetical protein
MRYDLDLTTWIVTESLSGQYSLEELQLTMADLSQAKLQTDTATALEVAAKAEEGYVPTVDENGLFIRDAAGAILYVETAVVDASWGVLDTLETVGAGGERIVHDVLHTTREIVEAGADAAKAAGTAAVSAGAAVAISTFSVGMFMTAAVVVGGLVWFTRK